MNSPQVIASGAHIIARDAVWRVVQVNPTSHGTHAWHVVGVSEIVRDQEAVFIQDYEREVEVLDPAKTQLVADPSSGHRAGLVYIESLLRDVPPPGQEVCIGHKAALDLLEYQLDPARIALGQLRPRILIADAVGLGKTLEAGILLAELARRGRARRILVVTTRAMLTQFQKELWARFAIPLVRLDSAGLQRVRERIPTNHNPFHHYDRAIISIDTLKQNNIFLRFVEQARWDVIVIDEAHNVAERGRQISDRARLANLLARRSDALILLTATPHDGSPRSFASLVNMLDPTAIANPDAYTKEDIRGLYVRRFKKDVQAQVQSFFPDRKIGRLAATASPAEEAAFDALTAIQFERLDRRRTTGQLLFRTVLEKALFSSPAACLATIEARLRRLRQDPDAAEYATDILQLEQLAERVRAIGSPEFRKYQDLVALLKERKSDWHWKPAKDDRLVIFTERIETLDFLAAQLPRDLGLGADEVRVLKGTLSDIEQQEIVEAFGKTSAKVRLLLASDVASEGLNLHYLCHRLVHFDVPWSLLVFQQRNGRIDRYGQANTPLILYLLTASKNEAIRGDTRVLECLVERDEKAGENIGDPSAFQGAYDVGGQELWTEEKMAAKPSAEALRASPPPEEDILELILGSGLDTAAAAAPAQPREALSIFPTDMDYIEASLTLLRGEAGVQFERPAAGGAPVVEITMPDDLARRWARLPSETRPADGVLCLTPDTARMQRELKDARGEESAWPRLQLLWPLHPVFGWINDRARARFGRQTAPVLTVERGLAPGERTVLVSALIPNRCAQPVVHRWYGVVFDRDDLREVQTLEAVLERTRLGREPISNPGPPGELAAIADLVPRAVEEARRRILDDRLAVDASNKARLGTERSRLAGLRKRREEAVAAAFAGKTGERARERREEELRKVDTLFRELERFAADALTTEPVPFIQVVAVLHREAAPRAAGGRR